MWEVGSDYTWSNRTIYSKIDKWLQMGICSHSTLNLFTQFYLGDYLIIALSY